jgi:hypothetical protein
MVTEFLYVEVCSLAMLFCLVMLFIKGRKTSDQYNYQNNWLYIGVACAFIREAIFLIGLYFPQYLLDVNVRLVLLFLFFIQYDYLISYYTKLRFTISKSAKDKTYYVITQVLLFLVPFLFVAFLMFGVNNIITDINLVPYTTQGIISFIYQFPENQAIDNFIKILIASYILISLISLKSVYKKIKGKKVKTTYILFIIQLLLIYPFTWGDLIQKIMQIFPIYRYFSTLAIAFFYISLGLQEQKEGGKQWST